MSLRPRPPRGSTWNIESTIGRKRDRLLLCRRGVTVVTPPCDFPGQSQPTALYPEWTGGKPRQENTAPPSPGSLSKGISPRKHLKVRTGSFICHVSGNTDWEVLYSMKALPPAPPADLPFKLGHVEGGGQNTGHDRGLGLFPGPRAWTSHSREISPHEDPQHLR